MARKFSENQLIVASHNPGKVREISALLKPFGIRAISAGDFELPEPEETGDTFCANAELKAFSAATLSRLPALADDSGLCVEALGGDPGIFSARWAGPEKDFGLAMQAVEDALADEGAKTPDQRRAYFACALTLAWPDGHMETFEGRVHGHLVWPGRGGQGFGYDPVFQADGYDITFGEMDPDEKHKISHRADAFQQLIAACFADA